MKLLVDDVDPQLGLIGFDNLDITEHQKSGRRQAGRTLFHRIVFQRITGNLLADEFVERLVVVESVDDVIAVLPSMLGEDIVGRSDLVRVSDEIEPVASPAFTKGV